MECYNNLLKVRKNSEGKRASNDFRMLLEFPGNIHTIHIHTHTHSHDIYQLQNNIRLEVYITLKYVVKVLGHLGGSVG